MEIQLKSDESECNENKNNDDNNNNTDDDAVNKISSSKKKKLIKVKKEKRGIVYLSFIPIGMNVNKLRQILSQYGEIDRIFLQPEKSIKTKRKKKSKFNNNYVEGWVEFKKKKVAKRVAQMLNGTQIGGKRKNPFYDCIWSIKYLHKFVWSHLAEQITYEKALRDQRLRFELTRAKKEADFYTSMVEKSKRQNKRKNDSQENNNEHQRNYKQRFTDEQIVKSKNISNEVDVDLLEKIFT